MIVIDTDGGVDDALALCVATKIVPRDQLIISTVFGNVSASQAATNVQTLLDLTGFDAPVYLGAEQASDGFRRDASDVHGTDGLGNASGRGTPEGSFAPLARGLETVTKSRAGDAPGVRILGIGPATNLPRIIAALGAEHVVGITVMAGALFDRGNITPHAEFNLFNDPAALAATLESGVPVTIVPLDICRKLVLRIDDLPGLAAFGRAQQLLTDAHRFYMARYRDTDGIEGCFPHDTIALLSMMYPSKFDVFQLPFDLLSTGTRRGEIRFDPDGRYRAGFCLGGDLAWVRRLFVNWALPAIDKPQRAPNQR